MLSAGQIQDTNIVEAKLDGEVETKEMEALRSEIDAVLAEHDKLGLLFVYEGLGRTEPKALWEDMKLETRVLGDIERMALVSEKGWLESLMGAFDRVTSIEVETFEPGRREEALRWLRA